MSRPDERLEEAAAEAIDDAIATLAHYETAADKEFADPVQRADYLGRTLAWAHVHATLAIAHELGGIRELLRDLTRAVDAS